MTSSRWCFTLNNYTDDEVTAIDALLGSDAVRYAVYGKEVGASGTPHLQGFVILGNPQRMSYLRRRLSARAHYESARGTSEQNRTYCIKDGDAYEFGVFPQNQGHRSDLDELLEWADTFTTENGRPPSSPDVAKHQPRAYLKYPRFANLVRHRQQPRQLEFGEPNAEWQTNLATRLENDPDDRSIDFIIDPDGGKGKTWFCRWLLTKKPDAVQVLGIGKKADLAHMVDETKTIFLFNIGRNQMDFISYGILEAIKDRMVVSTKYNGRTKLLAKSHVVVFCNEHPDMNKLTEDRYNLISI